MITIVMELRNRLKRLLGSRRSPAHHDTHQPSGQERDDRASSVTTLQKEVRALQQDITDLIASKESGATASGDPAHDAKLASLRGQLTQKQADLAKFQARI